MYQYINLVNDSLPLHMSPHLLKIHPLIQSAHIYDELYCTFYRKVFKSSHHLRIFYELFTELLRKIFTKILRGFTKLLRRFYEIFTKFLPNFYEDFTNIPHPPRRSSTLPPQPHRPSTWRKWAKMEILSMGGNPLPTVSDPLKSAPLQAQRLQVPNNNIVLWKSHNIYI